MLPALLFYRSPQNPQNGDAAGVDTPGSLDQFPVDQANTTPAGVASWYGSIPPRSISTTGVQKSYGTKKRTSPANLNISQHARA